MFCLRKTSLSPPLHLPSTKLPSLLISTSVIYALALSSSSRLQALLISLSPLWCLAEYLAKRDLKNICSKMNNEQLKCVCQFSCSHLHLKSHDPAASKTLLGCQSKLRTVERIGFLMCLLTHLQKEKIHFSLSTNQTIPK